MERWFFNFFVMRKNENDAILFKKTESDTDKNLIETMFHKTPNKTEKTRKTEAFFKSLQKVLKRVEKKRLKSRSFGYPDIVFLLHTSLKCDIIFNV